MKQRRVSRGVALAPMQLPQRMAATDALFWYAETALPIFRPIIAGLYILDRQPSPEVVVRTHELALALVPRLRQRVAEVPLGLALPLWADDPHFDPAYHIRHVSLAHPGTMRELLDLTAALFATPLDRERPLWEAYCIEGLEHGRSAYFFKMHHALVDGVGAVTLLQALTQAHPGEEPRVVHPQRTGHLPVPRGLFEAMADTGRELAAVAGRIGRLPLDVVGAPLESAAQVWRMLRAARGVVAELGNPVTQDPLVESTSGLSRRLDVLEIPLEKLQSLKKAFGVTINDIVLAALAGTLHAYHRQRRVHVDTLTCMVPMSLRGRDDRDSLGNRVGMFNIQLPVGERRADHRLQQIVRQTQTAKGDKRGTLYPFLVQTLTVIPAAAFRWLAQQSLGRVNLACTNIPGLATRRYLAGARVEAIYPFASVVQGTPLVVALFSYADAMNIGIDTDPEAIPDPHRISELFVAELEAMAERIPRRPQAHRGRKRHVHAKAS
ncbi:MAG: wax ester/triacylglycerol synthase family O-acyltransferase [Deltaproteobacteria bacterium]|nr:wax ester/triacylglycerol synthase family O-acyltransferase [Deltaproteobacteria bacterium]